MTTTHAPTVRPNKSPTRIPRKEEQEESAREKEIRILKIRFSKSGITAVR